MNNNELGLDISEDIKKGIIMSFNNENKEKYTDKKVIIDEKIFLKVNEILGLEYKIEKYKSCDIPEGNLDELLDVANDGFGINMGREDVKNHIFKSEDTFILKIEGEIVGFSSLAYLGDFIYRFGTVIRKKYQANGLYKKLSKTIMIEEKKYFLRTQNKNVIKSLEKSFDHVLYGKNALELMKSSLDNIDIDNFLIKHGDNDVSLNNEGIFKGVYGGKMGEKSRVNYIDDDFYSGFSSNEGDSLLVIYYNNK